MSSFCKAIIAGVVTEAPVEKFYGVEQPRRFMEMTVLVEQQGFGEGAAPRRSPFRVSVWDEALLDVCGTLTVNQRVVVDAEVQNDQWQGKDGKLRDSMRFMARNVIPGQAFGSTAPRRAQSSAEDGFSRGYGTPRSNGYGMQQRRASAPAPAPAPTEEEDDILF